MIIRAESGCNFSGFGYLGFSFFGFGSGSGFGKTWTFGFGFQFSGFGFRLGFQINTKFNIFFKFSLKVSAENWIVF